MLVYESFGEKSEVFIVKDRYMGGGICLNMVDVEDGMPRLTITLNMLEYKYLLGDGEIFVKSYSENEGLLQWLIDNELVTLTERVVSTGYVTVPICKMTDKLKEVL